MHWNVQNLALLERFYRGNLINSITGFKSLNLLGSMDENGKSNLAVFTQVLHLGADPALLGILFRPLVAGMNSLPNIRQSGWFTLNHVKAGEEQAAHWTSARWEISEFEATGFEAEFLPGIPAPFVKGSRIRMALKAEQEIPIVQNNTILIVAALQYLEVPDEALEPDGFANLILAGSLAGSGLDGYAEGKNLKRFAYARPDHAPMPIT